MVDARGGKRFGLELFRELQCPACGLTSGGLRGVSGSETQQQPAPQLVMVPLIRLDDVAIERGRLGIPRVSAELDELPVLHDRDRLSRELAGRHALHRASEAVQVLEERTVALGQRIEPGEIDAESGQTIRDETIMPRLVADLTRELPSLLRDGVAS
jgi:hypothetical protein